MWFLVIYTHLQVKTLPRILCKLMLNDKCAWGLLIY